MKLKPIRGKTMSASKPILLFRVLHHFQHCRGHISLPVVLWAEETSTYRRSSFCTVNYRPLVSKYQLSDLRSGVSTADLRGQRQVWYHCTTMAPKVSLIMVVLKYVLFFIFKWKVTTN